MQGQPGLAVDMYEFLSELITGLCETKEYSSADHGSRRHAIKLTLEKMAKVDDIQWLECQHYREMLPDQLEELFGTVFNKTDTGEGDQVFIQQFKAARRALDTFAFGSSTHPTYHRVSPRLKEQQQGQQQGKRDREAESDAAASERSSQITRKMHAEATSAEPKGQPAADGKVYVPDGSLRVKHPLEMRRYPDVDKITGLTEKLYQKINALLHVAAPFTFKNDHWVAMIDEAFMWMLHMQGSVSFSAELRNKVHQLIFDTLKTLETSPAVMEAIKIRPIDKGGWTEEQFAKQLRYRTHPPAKGKLKATMKRYGPVAKTPYTSPLIEENILDWDGRTELTLEESSLKAGDPGYEQLPLIKASNAPETQGPTASLSFSAAAHRSSSNGAGGSADKLPADHTAATSSSNGAPAAAGLPTGHHHLGGPHPTPAYPFYLPPAPGQPQGMYSAVSMTHQDAALMGTGAAPMCVSATWGSMPSTSWNNSMPPPPPKNVAGVKGKLAKTSESTAQAPALAAAPTPTPPEPAVISAPEHLPVAVKQTLETLLTVKTVKSFQLLKDVSPEVKKDLCSLDAPYLVASVFKIGKRTLQYWVGKPVATYDGKLICWYPSATGQGSIETAGIFDQVEDITLPPTFVIKIIPEDGNTDDAKHGDEAQAAVQDYIAEGKTTGAKTKALVKDTLAWLLAKCKIKDEASASQTKNRMVRAMINMTINDPDTLAELQKYM